MTGIRERSGGLAWAGILLGGAGLFIFNLVFGPIAVGLGVTALRRGTGARAAALSVLLGVADLAILSALLLHSASSGSLVWHFGS